MAEIRFASVVKRFRDGTLALDDLDLTIDGGELLVLVGPSGCGKSTALRIVAGLELPTGGEVYIDGEPLGDSAPGERDIAMVFQNYALYPHMSVAQNMSFPLRARRADRSLIQARVDEASRLLGLDELLEKKPRNLSGGQRQRVAMGRALVRHPRAFLMDEPLSNLDAQLRVQMRAEVVRMQRQTETTTVYVTHDQVEAMTMGDRVAVLLDGKLIQVASPSALYDDPLHAFVARFIGNPPMNLIRMRPDGAHRGTLRHASGEVKVGEQLGTLPECTLVGVRPEDLVVQAPTHEVGLRGEIALVEALGSENLVHVRLADSDSADRRADSLRDWRVGNSSDIVVVVPRTSTCGLGEAVRLTLAVDAVRLFDAETGRRIVAPTTTDKRDSWARA